jgi:hypothetical protein
MKRTPPQDKPQLPDGDTGFAGVRMRGPLDRLPPGVLSDGENIRCRDGVAETRPGLMALPWLHQLSGDQMRPYATAHTAAAFRDPDDVEWLVIVAEDKAYHVRPNNVLSEMVLPAGVTLRAPCKLVQAFDKLYLFRGRHLDTLVCDDVTVGWARPFALWAAGTYTVNTEVAYGPLITVSSATTTGTTATVTTATPHGYITGADVTIRGITETAYNGRKSITVTGDTTFTYTITAGTTTPATGATKTVSDDRFVYKVNVASTSNVPTHADWTRQYYTLPRGEYAVHHSNQMFVATAYNPDTGLYDAKVDYLVATDYLDALHFNWNDELRVNQGAEDQLVAAVSMKDNRIICFRNRSIGELSLAGADPDLLDDARLDWKAMPIGLAAPEAVAVVGAEVYYLAQGHGVTGLRYTETNQIQGIDVPLSDDIQPIIDRINWNYASGACMAWWDSKLYVALPLDSAELEGLDVVPDGATAGNVGSVYYYYVTVRQGQLYRYDKVNPTREWNVTNGGVTSPVDGLELTAASTLVRLGGWPGRSVEATLTPIYRGVNNCIAVYDFVQKRWTGIDTGPAACVKAFVRLEYSGRERLFALGHDGYAYLVEGLDDGNDLAGCLGSTSGAKLAGIRTRMVTRGYSHETSLPKSPRYADLSLASYNPSYTVTQKGQGVNSMSDIVSGRTRSRVTYYKPFTAQPWDPTNVNDDFDTPFRQDYSPVTGTPGLILGSNGVLLNLFQEFNDALRLKWTRGRAVRLEIVNTTGRLRLMSNLLTSTLDAPATGIRA